MLDQRKLNSLMYMRKARQAAACGDRAQCLKAFTDAFWLRCTDEDIIDIEYSSFFRYQFQVYLLGRADFLLPLDEGDEICALILQDKKQNAICMLLNKSASNINSQRAHIRKKLGLRPQDDLKAALRRRMDHE